MNVNQKNRMRMENKEVRESERGREREGMKFVVMCFALINERLGIDNLFIHT